MPTGSIILPVGMNKRESKMSKEKTAGELFDEFFDSDSAIQRFTQSQLADIKSNQHNKSLSSLNDLETDSYSFTSTIGTRCILMIDTIQRVLFEEWLVGVNEPVRIEMHYVYKEETDISARVTPLHMAKVIGALSLLEKRNE